MCETSDGNNNNDIDEDNKTIASDDEEQWLKKAVKQIENGLNITVNYLGKVELSQSLSSEPDPNKRVEIIIGCLRTIAKESGIIQEDVKIPEVAISFLKDSKIRAKSPRLAALNVSIKGFGLALVDSTVINPFISWHQLGEIAFAHIDPDNDNLIGYYAAKKSTNKRYCYCIKTDCASHILACMKLAFTLNEQYHSNNNIDLKTVANAMTPSPTSPSNSGKYKLLRISSPSEDDNNGLIHKEIEIPTESIHRQLTQVQKSSKTLKAVKNIYDDLNSTSSVTNLYLNVVIPPPPSTSPTTTSTINNPYHVKHIYRGLSNFLNFQNNSSKMLENIIEQPINDEEQTEEEIFRNAPPLPPPPKNKIRSRDKLNLHELKNRLRIEDEQNENIFYPEVDIKKINTQNSEDRLKKERKKFRERLRLESFSSDKSESYTPSPLLRRRKVNFKNIKSGIKKVANISFPLKKKLGTLRINESEIDDVSSEYSSLNSKSFNGSITSEVTSTPSSTDSGVVEWDELFVFPDKPPKKFSLKNIRRKTPTPPNISAIKFAQISEYLDEEPWFHGTINRDIAESRLVKDGEFLVRQSNSQPGQFILSALRGKFAVHICLVNQRGEIKSYGNEFGSIVQLIQYHFSTHVPICSKSSAVILKRPVARP